jgi:hypothetical protein
MRRLARLFAVVATAAAWLVVLSVQLPAQQAPDALRSAIARSGVSGLTSLRFVAFGATYAPGASSVRTPLPRYEGGLEATPHAFLRDAAAHRAVSRPVPLGTEITFAAHGRQYVGILDDRYLLDRVQVSYQDPVRGEVVLETFFRDYRRFGRVTFPMHITRDRGQHPELDLWVSSVEAHHNKEFRR